MPRYLTIGLLTMKPGHRAVAEQIADQGAPMVAQLPGFESVTYFVDEPNNVYGAISVWESLETAQQADEILTPQFQQAFGEYVEGSIDSRLYEIYEHKR